MGRTCERMTRSKGREYPRSYSRTWADIPGRRRSQPPRRCAPCAAHPQQPAFDAASHL